MAEQLAEPEHEVATVGAHETDEEAAIKVRNIITKMSLGRYGKKVLLRIEEPL
jgi:mitochondrial enoyl-[acyl-carrier protein] reductase / trans-2-enoyl-CoA reductase